MTEVDAFLDHSGVKGMKWGVRKDKKGAVKASSDAKRAAKHRGKPAHTLTNKQLKELHARMELEQKFSKMNPSKVDRGHARVKAVLAVAGTATTVYNMANSKAGQAFIGLGRSAVSGTPSPGSNRASISDLIPVNGLGQVDRRRAPEGLEFLLNNGGR